MSRWTGSKDGVQRTHLQIRFPLSVDDLAALLAWTIYRDARPVATLPATQVRELVADELQRKGTACLAWAPGLVTDAHRDAVRRAYGAES